jgi:RNA polymerase sigma-70 factor, ECF subfamily
MFNLKKNYTQLKDEELMPFVVKGNERAFDELYNRYSSKMHYYFFRMLGQNQDRADDFTQDLFIRVIEKGVYFDTNQRFSTWIYAVAGNMCKNEYRRLERRPEQALPENYEMAMARDGLYLESETDQHLFREHLQKALESLDFTHRQCFILRYQQDLGLREISEILGCPEGTVKSRLYYTLRKLAAQLHFFNPNFSKKKKHESQPG